MSAKRFFDPGLFRFLKQLAANNNRDWFNENKARYVSDVVAPATTLIESMEPRLATLTTHFRADPRRNGGSMMRIYRDTRFGNDKRPYKLNVGIQFRHEAGRDVHAPGFYLHLEPGDCFVAAGIWRPASPALRAIREFIADNPSSWRRARDASPFADHFTLSGESLKRPPRGFDADHPEIADLKRKDFIAFTPLTEAEVCGEGLADRITAAYGETAPLMRFLCAALDVPF